MSKFSIRKTKLFILKSHKRKLELPVKRSSVPDSAPGSFFFYVTIIPYNNPLSDHSIAIATFNINVSMLTLMFCLWFDYWGKLFSISSCPAILTDWLKLSSHVVVCCQQQTDRFLPASRSSQLTCLDCIGWLVTSVSPYLGLISCAILSCMMQQATQPALTVETG